MENQKKLTPMDKLAVSLAKLSKDSKMYNEKDKKEMEKNAKAIKDKSAK